MVRDNRAAPVEPAGKTWRFLVLEHHELVKVRIAADDRDSRDAAVADLVERSGAQLVQRIGNVACLFRRNPEASQIALPR